MRKKGSSVTKNNQNIDFMGFALTNVKSNTVNESPTDDGHASSRKHITDNLLATSVCKSTFVASGKQNDVTNESLFIVGW